MDYPAVDPRPSVSLSLSLSLSLSYVGCIGEPAKRLRTETAIPQLVVATPVDIAARFRAGLAASSASRPRPRRPCMWKRWPLSG